MTRGVYRDQSDGQTDNLRLDRHPTTIGKAPIAAGLYYPQTGRIGEAARIRDRKSVAAPMALHILGMIT